MEGRLQLAMTNMSEEHKAAINDSEDVSLPPPNLPLAEEKLRKVVGALPKFIHGYNILTMVSSGWKVLVDATKGRSN